MNAKQQSKENFWSRFADDFESRNNYVVGQKEMTRLKDKLSEETQLGKLLELGCGDGAFTKVLAPNAKCITATDWSEEMVAAARGNLAEIKSIHIQRENCFGLSFPDNCFDTVFMGNLLHVIPTPEKALDECLRVLKPKGRIIILSFTTHGMKPFAKLGMVYRYLRTYGKPPTQSRTLTTEETSYMLEAEGFNVHSAELLGKRAKAVYVKGSKAESVATFALSYEGA